LTDEAVKQAREYEIAVDSLNDTYTGLAVTIGTAVVPATNNLLKMANADITAVAELGNVFEGLDEIMATTAPGADRVAGALNLISDWAANIINNNLPSFMEQTNKSVGTATTGYILMAQAIEKTTLASVDGAALTMAANDDQLALIFQLSDAYAMNAEAHAERTRKILLDMTLEKIAMLDGEKGFSDAEMAKALAVAQTAGAVEAAAIRELIAMEGMSTAIANGTIAAKDMKMILESLTTHGWTVQVAIQMQNLQNLRDVLSANSAANPGRSYPQGGRASGGPVSANSMYVVGEEGPELFVPNQSGTIIPNGGGAGSGGGRGAASSIVVNLSMNSVVSMADRESMKRLTPFIIDGIREAQAQGYIR